MLRFSSKPTSPASHPAPPTTTNFRRKQPRRRQQPTTRCSFAPLAANESTCPNEQKRDENNSTRLPECRAYELVTNRPKGGYQRQPVLRSATAKRSLYQSSAGNIDESGQGNFSATIYVAETTADSGWETLAHLNGPKGTPYYPRGSLQWQFFVQYSPGPRTLDLVDEAEIGENLTRRTYANRMENLYR